MDTDTLPPGTRLTSAAGWLSLGIGVVHGVVAPLVRAGVWSQVIAEGVWNTVTLKTSIALAAFERSEGFWLTLGSFGVPLTAFGAYVVWSTRQRHRVPGWLGWILVAWGTTFVVVLPVSPGWAFPVIGALLVMGDRRRRRSLSPRPRPGATVAGPLVHSPS